MASVRKGDWKLIHYYAGIPGRNEDELHDLANDPGEQHDLLVETPTTTNEERTREMRHRLEAWLEETRAKLPVKDPKYDQEAEAERLAYLAGEFMREREEQAAAYLDPEWKPNEDWWGSLRTED